MMGIYHMAESDEAGLTKVERVIGDSDNLPGHHFKFYPIQGLASFVVAAPGYDQARQAARDERRKYLGRWPQTQEEVDALNAEIAGG